MGWSCHIVREIVRSHHARNKTTSSNNPQINRETSSEAGLGLQYKNRESQEYPDTQESAVEVGYQLSIIQIVL